MRWCSFKVCGINKTASYRPSHTFSTGTDDDLSSGHIFAHTLFGIILFCCFDADITKHRQEKNVTRKQFYLIYFHFLLTICLQNAIIAQT